MASNVLIISRGSAFMTNAIVNNLQKSGIPSHVIEPDIKKIQREREETDIYMIYAGSFIFEVPDVLVYIKDICAEDEKKVCVIGYPDEIAEVMNAVTQQHVAFSFERPFDMKKLIAEIEKFAVANEERKKGKHILLVDDDVMFLKMMQDWLSNKYNVTISRSGMQAIVYITKHTPDLILLDYDMPITPGPQVMEMIRSEPDSARIPIIFLTGNNDRESVMRVMSLKPQGYLLKAMDKQQILDSIDNFFKTQRWKNAQN